MPAIINEIPDLINGQIILTAPVYKLSAAADTSETLHVLSKSYFFVFTGIIHIIIPSFLLKSS